MIHKNENELDHGLIPKEIIPEEFPEGPYGSTINSDKILQEDEDKESLPSMSPYDYPEQGLQRQVPGAYPVKNKDEH